MSVTFKQTHRQTTVECDITGADPIPSLLGPGRLMQPWRARALLIDGELVTLHAFGPRLSSTGKLLKTFHSVPLDPEDPDAPAWVADLVALVTGKENQK